MARIKTILLAGGVLAACAGGAWAQSDAKKIPDLMAGGMGWASAGGLTAVAGSPSPVVQDPKVKYTANNTDRQADGSYAQPTWRYADLNNPNLTDFAKAGLKKSNDMIDDGFAMYNRSSRCWMPGVVSLNLSPGRTYFIQEPDKVLLIWQRDQIVRTIWLNKEHSKDIKPSWFGESVGHYEGDELVVDTIGETTKTFVDLFRTPHSDKLHVIERFKVIEDGKALQVEMTVEDPASFVQPWKGTKRWQLDTTRPTPGNVTGTYAEEIRCMDGEMVNPFNKQQAAMLEPLPVAAKADF